MISAGHQVSPFLFDTLAGSWLEKKCWQEGITTQIVQGYFVEIYFLRSFEPREIINNKLQIFKYLDQIHVAGYKITWEELYYPWKRKFHSEIIYY